LSKIRILFAIDGLRSGGKERRFLSLVRYLSLLKEYHCELIILNRDIHYTEVYAFNTKLNIIDRKNSKEVSSLKQFYMIAKKFKPNIIHSWDTLSTLYAIPSAKMLHSKLITSKITDAPINYKKLSGYGILSEICFKLSDLILSNSFAGLKAYSLNSKSRVIYNGFNFERLNTLPDKFKTVSELQITEPFLVSMVASFSINKDFKTFLEAAHMVRSHNETIGFLCVGDGPLKSSLEEKYKSDGIYFLGRRNDVEAIINCSDIGVLLTSSKVHGEGISNSLMEFMALQKLVIASNSGGNSELIENGISGIIIKNNDGRILANIINRMVEDRDKLQEIGDNAGQRIAKHFEISRMVDEFISVYKSICSRHVMD
jgi:glycosyltransferase involved in cell wall biosynthesis